MKHVQQQRLDVETEAAGRKLVARTYRVWPVCVCGKELRVRSASGTRGALILLHCPNDEWQTHD